MPVKGIPDGLGHSQLLVKLFKTAPEIQVRDLFGSTLSQVTAKLSLHGISGKWCNQARSSSELILEINLVPGKILTSS